MLIKPWNHGRFVELSVDECWEFVSAHSVGRVAWCVDGEPGIAPVNFLSTGGAIWMRTSPDSQLARHGPAHSVVMELDELYPYTQSATSVILAGRAEAVPDDQVPREASDLDPWPAEPKPLFIRFVPTRVTGRRLLPT